jgi:hypothetical protein
MTGIVLASALLALTISTLGALVTTRTVSNTGNIITASNAQLGTYSDSGCTIEISSIQWGDLSPGDTATSTMYVRNEGNVAITLSIQAANWNPTSAEGYLTLGWNRDGYVLQPNQTIEALLTLTVSSNINGITNFSFDIIITGVQLVLN